MDGKVTYTYDGMGNIISVNENGKQQYKFSYDKLNRLISEKDLYKNEEICYTYDNNGNILTKITGIVGGVTTLAGIGSGLFASAEYQEAFTGNNWMLDAGMSEGWYNGLLLMTAVIATLGTFARSVMALT
mgnify:CR=1 FL=1